MTTEYLKPLPDVTNRDNAPFWAGANAHKLMCQRCARCSALRWPPRRVCPECLSLDATWVELRPTGRLYSFTTYYRAFDSRFSGDIPYSVGQIELDDGPRMIGLLRAPPEKLLVDSPVRAVFHRVAPEVTLVQWEQS
jgi:uncharacterized OB-fold protein